MSQSISILNGELVIILSNIRWFSSLRWKLFTAYFFVSFVPLLFFSSICSQAIERYFQRNRENSLLGHAEVIADMAMRANYMATASGRQVTDFEMQNQSKEGGYRIFIIDEQGMVVYDSNAKEAGKTYLVPEVMKAFTEGRAANLYKEEDTVHAAVSIADAQMRTVGAALLVASFQDVSVLLTDIGRTLLLITIGTAIVVTALVLLISQLIIDPLKKILNVVQKMSDGHLDQRIPVVGHDEFSELAVAFNNMSEKLEQVEMTRQDFVSNVSHELKTPLSSMKVLSDSIISMEDAPVAMYKEFLQDISSEVDRMAMIINDLLTLVKLDQRESALNIKETNLNKMLEDMLKRLYPLAEQKNIELLYEDVRSVDIQADEMKLSLAISNLVENAIKYTKEEGTVKVKIDADHRYAYITVQDTGIGIDEEEQNKVFTRFYRVDKTRDRETGGTGLGLSITHSTVMLHQGSIRLASKEGVGTTFTVRLPLHLTL